MNAMTTYHHSCHWFGEGSSQSVSTPSLWSFLTTQGLVKTPRLKLSCQLRFSDHAVTLPTCLERSWTARSATYPFPENPIQR